MTLFIKKILLFAAILIGIAGSVLLCQNYRYGGEQPVFDNWETESNLLMMPTEESFELCLLGASSARVLSRHQNHQRMESILGKRVINLAQGIGQGGPLKNRIYLSYFFKKNNKVKQIVYFLPSQSLFTENYDQLKMEIEPFQLDFFWHAKDAGISNKTLFNYVRSKFRFDWKSIDETRVMARKLDKIDEQAVQKNLANFARYESQNPASFVSKFKEVEAIVSLAESHGAKLTMVFHVDLMHDVPHQQEVHAALLELQKTHQFEIVDLSDAMNQPEYFYDHAHLNSAGVEFFVTNFMTKF